MNPAEVDSMILDQVKKIGPCTLEKLVQSLTDLSWNQVFAVVDRLSRAGQLMLRQSTRFEYMISVGPRELLTRRSWPKEKTQIDDITTKEEIHVERQ
jgi:hypothetical protein